MRQRLIVPIALVLILAGCAKPDPSAEQQPAAQTPAAPAAAAAPEPATVEPVDPAQFAVVHEYTDMFYRGEIDLLHGKFTDEMSEALTLEQLSTLYEHAITAYGRETRVIGEESQTNEDYRAFVRWARFDKTDDIIEIQWILRDEDRIAGFYIRPASKRIQTEGKVAIQPS